MTRETFVVAGASGRTGGVADLAAVLATLVGRPVIATPAPLAALVPAFTSRGATPALAEQVRQLHGAIAEGRLAAVGAEALRGSVNDCFAPLLRRS
jgi:hypothetical protein